MPRWTRHKKPPFPFDDYGFTAEDFRAYRTWALSGGPKPDADKIARVTGWFEDTYEMRRTSEAAKVERRRRLWHGLSTLAGIGAISLFTAAFTLSMHLHVSQQGIADMGIAAMLVGLAAIAGRENNRRRDP